MIQRATAPSVPIHHGSPRFQEVEAGPFRITEVRFSAGSRLEPHYHDRPNIGVMLGGSFELAFGSRSYLCEPGAVFVEPAGDTHCNCMGCRGARVLAVQPDPDRAEFWSGKGIQFLAPEQSRHPHALHLARRLARECHTRDAFAPLMIEGLALELLAVVGRFDAARSRAQPSDRLSRIAELLRDLPPRRVSIGELADEAGVHPAHLARQFRARYGRSLGGFLLERRLEWAAEQLTATERPIAGIAIQAGFSDQSHFTRRFREYAGVTPKCYRLAAVRPQPAAIGD
jgi:AraC family transcriptional regulator